MAQVAVPSQGLLNWLAEGASRSRSAIDEALTDEAYPAVPGF